MKIILLLFFVCLFSTARSQTQNEAANTILKKTSDKLTALSGIRYDLKRELNYPSENYHSESVWHEYFDFRNKDSLGFRYQIEDTLRKIVFNGTEQFDLDNQTKSIHLTILPDQASFQSLSALYNSLLTLRNILPVIINDPTVTKTIRDTVINNNSYYAIVNQIGKRRIKNLGNSFDPMKVNLSYTFIIDKKDFFPLEVIQRNNSTDYIKTSFTNIHIHNTNPPTEYSWYASSYSNEYTPALQKDISKVIPVGSMAGDWTLPLYNKKENISLSQLKGKVILLDFWIKNCGPCIESVPHLNALQTKFTNSSFEILGINAYDSQKDISWFCDKHQVKYTVLTDGKDVASQYGISGFPTAVLIDKKGKVLYTGEVNTSKLERMIQEAIMP